jgi:hypothetical protein
MGGVIRGEAYTAFPLHGEKADGSPFLAADGTPTIEISKDGGTFTAVTPGTITHADEYLWKIDLSETETDCDQFVLLMNHASMQAFNVAAFTRSKASALLEDSMHHSTVVTAADASTFTMAAGDSANDFYVDGVAWFVSGPLQGQGARVNAYTGGGTLEVVTETPYTQTPGVGNGVVILGHVK